MELSTKPILGHLKSMKDCDFIEKTYSLLQGFCLVNSMTKPAKVPPKNDLVVLAISLDPSIYLLLWYDILFTYLSLL